MREFSRSLPQHVPAPLCTGLHVHVQINLPPYTTEIRAYNPIVEQYYAFLSLTFFSYAPLLSGIDMALITSAVASPHSKKISFLLQGISRS